MTADAKANLDPLIDEALPVNKRAKKDPSKEQEGEINIAAEIARCNTLTQKMWLQRGTWQQIQRYVLPYCGRNLYGFRSDFEDLGQRKDNDRLNSEPYLAVESFVGAVSQGTAPKDREFFAYTIPDDELMKDKQVQLWLLACRDEVKQVLLDGGFYENYKNFLREFAGFGSANMVVYNNPDGGALYCTDTVGEYVWGLGKDGRVGICYRRKLMSVDRLYEEFGDELPENILKLHRKGDLDTNWMVYNCIKKRDSYNPRGYGLQETGKYVSFWFLDGQVGSTLSERFSEAMPVKQGNKPMRVEYFEGARGDDKDCPFIAERWYAPGNQIYGMGALGQIMGDAIGLQTEQSRLWEIVDKSAAPALMAPETLRHAGGLNRDADDINWYPAELKPDMIFPVYAGKFDIPALTADIETVVKRIKKALYAEALTAMSELANTKADVTAYLASKVYAEKIDQIGPLLEVTGNILSKVLERTWQICLSQGRLPPPPPQVPQGMELKVEYVSFLFQTQKKAQDLAGQSQLLQTVSEVYKIFPPVAQMVNWYEFIAGNNRGIGNNPDLIVSQEQWQGILQQMQQQADQAKKTEMVQQVADAAQKLGQTQIGDRNVLEHAAGVPGGQAA